VIHAENIRKTLGGREILRGLSFRVMPGEIVGFLGPNGAGKTTTLRILSGFFPFAKGSLKVAGIDMRESPREAKRHIGYVPENIPYYGELCVRDYLSFVAEVKGVERNRRKELVGSTMERFNLQHRAGQALKALSRGFQKRVCLAQAVVNDPRLLLLDEPTNSLDPMQIAEFRRYVSELSSERTVFLSSHLLSEVEALCSKVIIIDRGQIKAMRRLVEIEDLESFYLESTASHTGARSSAREGEALP
jgi:ABC-2 type transport system ATP-binding protein